MTVFLLRRLIQAAVVVLAMSLIVFLGRLRHRRPDRDPDQPRGRPDRARAGDRARSGSTCRSGSNTCVFLGGALHGDLGRSFVFNEPALRLILQRMPATLELAVGAVLLAMIIGMPLGLYAGLQAARAAVQAAIMAGSILGFSLPTFWVGLMLIMVFAVQLGWLPSTGRGETVTLFGVQLVLPDARWPGAYGDAGAQPRAVQHRLVLRLTRAGVRETLPHGLREIRPRQGPLAGAGHLRACAARTS